MQNKTMTTGEKLPSVSVDLTEEEAKLFLEFRKYQDTFKKMIDCGVFETQPGSIILHFNLDGVLSKIDRNQVLFFVTSK